MPFTRFKRASNQKIATNAATDSDHQTAQKRIAIIGSGVSGLTCAHYLGTQHDVTVFEANDYIGGHVNTINVALQDGKKSKE
ncbi:FAD-dependent oxidoreductase [Psychrobacter sp. JCM 18901]|uniref:FAD-dependent oxidoreductase n=1 Tax=Psychrobacter sp. JCM 18901 TaxID=1298609 RepID=UPI0004B1F100|nr:FAD-dependent oxidoreductase [Psychrobacter sp. JCM 18901]